MAVSSPARWSRANASPSRRSVLMRSPLRVGLLDGLTTSIPSLPPLRVCGVRPTACIRLGAAVSQIYGLGAVRAARRGHTRRAARFDYLRVGLVVPPFGVAIGIRRRFRNSASARRIASLSGMPSRALRSSSARFSSGEMRKLYCTVRVYILDYTMSRGIDAADGIDVALSDGACRGGLYAAGSRAKFLVDSKGVPAVAVHGGRR